MSIVEFKPPNEEILRKKKHSENDERNDKEITFEDVETKRNATDIIKP